MSSLDLSHGVTTKPDVAETGNPAASKGDLSDRLMRRLKQPRRLSPVAGEAVGNRQRQVPISLAQQRLWLLDRLEPGLSTYNMVFQLDLEGVLDAAVLGRSLDEISRRHEALRTTFEVISGEPMQCVHRSVRTLLPVVDLSGLVTSELVFDRLAAIEAARPFDLEHGPLLRCMLLRESDQQRCRLSKFLVSFHHIVVDGWSTDLFFEELSKIYRAFLAGKSHSLPPVRLQYPDYANRQRSEMTQERLEPQLEFWRGEIGEEPPPLELPTDRPRPAAMSQRGDLLRVSLPADLKEAVRRLAGRCATSPFFVLLGLFQVLLGRWAGATRVLVGTAMANRPRRELHGLIGFVVNTVVVATDVGGEQSVLQLVEKMRKTAIGVLKYQETPFERLVEELGRPRDLSRTPLFQVVFTMGGDSHQPFELAPGLTARISEVHSGTAKWDLMVALEDRPDGFCCDVEYASDLFDVTTMRRLVRQFERLALAALEEPERTLDSLPLLSVGERHQVVVEWNDTNHAYPRESTVAELVGRVAAARPGAIAVVFGDHHLSYGALWERAGSLAARLVALGAGPETLVAIASKRSVELIVGLLAILEAGGAYLPLDAEYPASRLTQMVEDSGVDLLLTQRALLPGSNSRSLPTEVLTRMQEVVLLDEEVAQAPPPPARARASALNLAYATYTSGSTGRPKAVMISNRSVARLITGLTCCPPRADVIHLQVGAISFDASTFEIWNALAAGGRLVLSPPGVLSLSQLADLLVRHKVSDLFLTTALFHQMVAERLSAFDLVDRVLAGGEEVPVADVERYLDRQAAEKLGGTLADAYGPTECTTFATVYPMHAGDCVPAVGVPIGRPIGGTDAFVVDSRMTPLPVGVVGELMLAGDGLARGYLGQPALTAERFVPDPLSGRLGSRLYHTGDRARWRVEGTVDFLGRLDRQVKMRGFRIELGEIEAVLGRHPSVSVAQVLLRQDRPGDSRLVAYVEPKSGSTVEVHELRRHLEQELPRFMVPSAVVILERMPITANGKIDRDALPSPSIEGNRQAELPRTEFEIQVSAMWASVLGVEEVGLHDSFWDLGGHSLLATKVMARVQEHYGIELPISALFDAPRLVDFTVVLGTALLGAEEER